MAKICNDRRLVRDVSCVHNPVIAGNANRVGRVAIDAVRERSELAATGGYNQMSAVPTIVMVFPVVSAAPIAAPDINDWRRGISGVRLIDHWRRPQVDAEINPRICDRGCAKREDTES
jgi:hypothetical protein